MWRGLLVAALAALAAAPTAASPGMMVGILPGVPAWGCSRPDFARRSALVVAKAKPQEEEKGLGAFVSKMKAAGTKKRLMVEKYLKDKNIDLKEIPKAIVIYEVTSAGLMFGVWAVCFLAQPTQRGLVMAKIAKPGAYEAAMAKGQQIASKRVEGVSAMKRLATSYAEGAVLRTAIKPVIIPAKLFITWKLQQAVNLLMGRKADDPGKPAVKGKKKK